MMRTLIIAAAAIIGFAAPAHAGRYALMIEPGQGPMLQGPASMHALDLRSDDTWIRIIAPATDIQERGTIRVLVMNRTRPAYIFGPDQVSLLLPDGRVLKEVPYEVFDRAETLVGREVGRAAAVDRAVKNGIASAAESANSGMTAQSISGHTAGNVDVRSESMRHDELSDDLPGAKLLGQLDGVLRPLKIGPKEAWGGYLVFELPRDLRKAKAVQPLTIVVRTGTEVHRVKASLRRL